MRYTYMFQAVEICFRNALWSDLNGQIESFRVELHRIARDFYPSNC